MVAPVHKHKKVATDAHRAKREGTELPGYVPRVPQFLRWVWDRGVVPHASSQDGRGMHVPHLVCACAVRVTKLFCTKRKWRAAHPFGDTPPSGGCACVCLSPLSRTYLVPIPPGPFPPGNGSLPRVFLRRGVRYLSAAARRERFRKYLRAEVREGNSVLPAPQKATQQQKHKPAPFFFAAKTHTKGKQHWMKHSVTRQGNAVSFAEKEEPTQPPHGARSTSCFWRSAAFFFVFLLYLLRSIYQLIGELTG